MCGLNVNIISTASLVVLKGSFSINMCPKMLPDCLE